MKITILIFQKSKFKNLVIREFCYILIPKKTQFQAQMIFDSGEIQILYLVIFPLKKKLGSLFWFFYKN